MSNYSKILLKMNSSIQGFATLFEQVIHPAAGKMEIEKKKRKSTVTSIHPKATPDSLNIRELARTGESFRRNPAP